jgi:RNA polymerase sigma factor for flagellar operon FliA
MTPEQQGLALRFIPMAKSLARPLKHAWPLEAEEFESAALLALVEAAQSFDPTRGVKFATFARYRIWGALRDVQREMVTRGWRGDVANMPTVTGLTPDAEERGTVLGATPEPPADREVEAVDWVTGVLRHLPGKHREACRLMYLEGLTQGEVAERMGYSKSRVSYLHSEAMDMLRYVLADAATPPPRSAYAGDKELRRRLPRRGRHRRPGRMIKQVF